MAFIIAQELNGLTQRVMLSIVDFYRMDRDKFVFEFPKTPVILLQPSMRFNDIENVGKTGAHWTCHGHIEQAGTSYWKEKAIDLDFKLLTEVFGIDPKENPAATEAMYPGNNRLFINLVSKQ